MNIVNGGAHADNNVDLQEFMIMPLGAPNFPEAVRMGAEVFHTSQKDPPRQRILNRRRRRGRIRTEPEIEPRSDRAHSQSHRGGRLQAGRAGRAGSGCGLQRVLRQERQIRFQEVRQVREERRGDGSDSIRTGLSRYPIVSIEDGLAEDDWDGWQILTRELGRKVQLVGDDLFVTNTERLAHGMGMGVGNAILIKVNQIGTLTETLDAIEMAQARSYGVVISHRSGESEDTFIADLAVATNAGQIKTGSMSRTDRVAKYNQLLRINEELGAQAVYAGAKC